MVSALYISGTAPLYRPLRTADEYSKIYFKIFFQTTTNKVCSKRTRRHGWGWKKPVRASRPARVRWNFLHSTFSTPRGVRPKKLFSVPRRRKKTSDGSDDGDCVQKVKGEADSDVRKLDKSRPKFPPKIGSRSWQLGGGSANIATTRSSIRFVLPGSRLPDAVSGLVRPWFSTNACLPYTSSQSSHSHNSRSQRCDKR
jgi:hypothetical protein